MIDKAIQITYNNCMSKTFNISLPELLVKQMDSFAEQNFMSRSELIRTAVLKELKTQDDNWEQVVDFTKINKQGVDAKDVLSALKELK